MPLWGRNDQAVTANSTTTRESSNGAPIGIWRYVKGGKTGLAANSVHTANANFGNTSPGSRANVDVSLFNNVTPSALVSGQAVGLFGVSATEQSNNVVNKNQHGAHAGWNLRRAGTGPIVSISYTGTATGYSNTDQIIVASPVAGGNAKITFTTNTSGGALSNFVVVTAGFGFLNTNASANAVYANSLGGATVGGSGATFLPVAGGRAGRVHIETLVAMHSLGAQSAPFGTPATTADSAGDNTLFPGT